MLNVERMLLKKIAESIPKLKELEPPKEEAKKDKKRNKRKKK